MVSLTFYGGAGEIGGNKILLQHKDAKIYLDFGEEYFWEYLQPRAANGFDVVSAKLDAPNESLFQRITALSPASILIPS